MGTSANWKVVSEKPAFMAAHGGGLRGYVTFDGGPFAFGVWLKEGVQAVVREVGLHQAVVAMAGVRVVREGDVVAEGDVELLKKWTVSLAGTNWLKSYYCLLRNVQGDLLPYATGECPVWLKVGLTGWEDYEYVVDMDKGEVWYRKPWQHREAEKETRALLELEWKRCNGWELLK